MPTIEQIVEQIRHAVFGKDVRENIALGIEQCYEDATEVTVSTTKISGTTDDYRAVFTEHIA